MSTATKPKKKRTIIPTIRQKRAAKIAADNVSQNLHKSQKDILLEAGYDISTAEKPQLVTETKGYKAELARYGLTEELVTTALVDDIKAKPARRVPELNLAADILNMRRKTPDDKPTINIAIFTTEQQARIAARIIEQR